jgi:Kef-type K+ transport system membrane component KefB
MTAAVATTNARRLTWLGAAGYLALLIFGIGFFLIVRYVGAGLTAAPPQPEARPVGQSPAGRTDVILHVVATLAAVIALGFTLGRVLRAVGQPPVIGEVVAGILLGPSLLGAVSPEAMHLLIPSAATDPHGQVAAALQAVSELGVILYMFLVGLELNAGRLKHQAQAALAIAHASIMAPFVLGAAIALGLYPVYSSADVSFTSFALFLGAAMAVTAFPVLARILTDRGLERTELGIVALGCAAADDVTAWCLLAVVVGVARSAVGNAGWVIGGAIAFIAFMFLVARPLLKRATRSLDARHEPLSPLAVSGTFLGLLLCSLTTEAIGIHAVFGAFLMGAVLPHDGQIAREFATKLKDLVTILLLPAFFASTGMRTQINLMSGWADCMWCGAIILVATVGKFGGTLVAARLNGLSWRYSTALGALMNTRGLMGLIVLNIGLDLGVISPKLFAMMVVMAVVTTVATAPLLRLFIGGSGTHLRVANP